MSQQRNSSCFQKAIETVEGLPADDQALRIEIISQRLMQQQRAGLVKEIAEARRAYQHGKVRRGTVADLIRELKE